MYQVQPLLIKYKEIIFDQIKLENERNLISQSIPNCNLENNRLFTASKVYYNKKCKFKHANFQILNDKVINNIFPFKNIKDYTVCDEKFLKYKSQNYTVAFNSNGFKEIGIIQSFYKIGDSVYCILKKFKKHRNFIEDCEEHDSIIEYLDRFFFNLYFNRWFSIN